MRSPQSIRLLFALCLLPLTWLQAADTPLSGFQILQENCFRCHSEEKRKGGLVLTSKSAALKGWIECESKKGEGTTFHIYLPEGDSNNSKPRKKAAPIMAEGGNETVMLVEDEPSLRSLATRILKKHGYAVIEAADAIEAVEKFDAHADEIDILVTDVIMPRGKNGTELAVELRSKVPELKVIFCSGFSEGFFDDDSDMEENATFLNKPYTPAAFAQTIRDILDGRPPTPQE